MKNLPFLLQTGILLLILAGCKKANKPVVPVNTILVLQPSNNPNEITLVNNNGTDNSGVTIEMPVEAWTNGGTPFTIREVFKFDLSTIPSSASVTAADLALFSDSIPINGNLSDANFGDSNAVLLEAVTQDWNPATVTWFNQPTTSSSYVDTIAQTNSSFLNVDVDVTGTVSNMIKSTVNYGFLLKMQNEVTYNSRIFCSSSYSDTTRHPKLTVHYTYTP
jgi:hypothetical protein